MIGLRKVISGGQTGVDQAALRAAKDCGVEIGGWCPPGRVSEDGPIPAAFPLKETPQERSPDAPDVPRSQRTQWNVRDADGTLVIGTGDAGTKWTIECTKRYKRPLLVCEVDEADAEKQIQQWIVEEHIRILNVAGPSEAVMPGIGEHTYILLRDVFEDL